MSIIKEFKTFAMKGNVLDLAVGIIIGGAFGKIVGSLVEDVLMPPIGFILGGINFADIKIALNPSLLDPTGTLKNAAVTINIGKFIQASVDFAIIAFAVFLIVKGVNKLQKKQDAAEAVAKVVEPPADVKLLGEIRDLLKEKR
jgi:large conductance mechanosensitive channel